MTQVAQISKSPYEAEIEQAVLGSLLLGHAEPSGLSEELFYDPCHAHLFSVIKRRGQSGLLISPVALAEEVRAHEGLMELGGPSYLVSLAGAALSSGFSGYVRELDQLRSKRALLTAMNEAQAAIVRGDTDAAKIAGDLETSILNSAPTTGAAPVSMKRAALTAIEDAMAAYQGEATPGLRSGIGALDRIYGGMYPGDLVLLGGRPSMGKTAAALSISLNVAREGQGVVICSLEMNPEAMALRAISEASASSRASVAYSDIRQGNMSESQAKAAVEAAQRVSDLPITFLSREFSDIGSLMSGAKRAKKQLRDNMKLLVIDYAQLLRAPGNSRYEQITNISIALKSLAGQLGVPVLALSQLSRQLESREDKRPMMSDLRESGQLEQDADAVLFCYREEYYLEREEPDASEDIESHADWQAAMTAQRNRLDIIVAKQRQGAIGTAHVRCNPALNLIWEE